VYNLFFRPVRFIKIYISLGQKVVLGSRVIGYLVKIKRAMTKID